MDTLRAVVATMRSAAERAGVELVTGDTKVVDRGKADGLFINTAGIGLVEGRRISPTLVEPGDAILISGDIGAHGVAIMSVREGLEFESPIITDCAPLWKPVEALLAAGLEVHCLRDLTRGGLASALNEIAQARSLSLHIEETAIPVTEAVRGACEILGLDPAYVANEGRFVAFVPAAQAAHALSLLQRFHPQATIAGHVLATTEGRVQVQSRIGGTRLMDMLSGEQLPRIC